ncbi:unnamed protein product [Lactuca virosa]|uniref:Secreted protein n=1 Tax=Lactuca virosa TaxID=75947 RepID=A0AAU9MFD0_9ASTR|nr:unnamed protein product [Lactuca virosa]
MIRFHIILSFLFLLFATYSSAITSSSRFKALPPAAFPGHLHATEQLFLPSTTTMPPADSTDLIRSEKRRVPTEYSSYHKQREGCVL